MEAPGCIFQPFTSASILDLLLAWFLALLQMVQAAHGIKIIPHYTKAHVGHPGNEAADILAKHAAMNCFGSDHFWDGCRSEHTLPSIWVQSFWLLYRRDLRPFWQGHCLVLPTPKKEADEEVAATLESWQDHIGRADELTLSGTFMSCNVLTLKQSYTSAYTALRAYLQLCASKNIALAALQETRLRNLAFRDDHYLARSHPAQRGHGGVMLALNLQLFKLKDGHGQIQQVQEDQWTVVASSHQFILTRLWTGSLDMLIANLRVPHSGHSEAEITQFWHDFQQAIPPHLREKEMILMGDFNARVGSVTSIAIGSLGEEEETLNGGLLYEFLQRSGLFLPAGHSGEGCLAEEHTPAPSWFEDSCTMCMLPLMGVCFSTTELGLVGWL